MLCFYNLGKKMIKSVPKSKIRDAAGTEKEYVVQYEGKRICIKNERYYTGKHMWAKKTVEGNFKVGVADYAQKFLREKVALVEIFKNAIVGNEVEAGEAFGVVYGRLYANLDLMRPECMAFDLTAPLSGRIVKINHRVMENPQLINEAPYECWIVIIEPTNLENEIESLLSPSRYKRCLKELERASPFRIV